jgi:DNA polymerase
MSDTSPDEIAALGDRVRRCTGCRLSGGRTQAVPGDGPAGAKVMFVGEGPGYHEDRQGKPFVGAAGQLLSELLSGVGLSRDRVYVTNIVKCRPPENRDPLPDEIAACRPFLEEQIALVDPEVIVTLGRFALEVFAPGARISRVHGQPRRLGSRTFLPMLHPAAALHQPSWRPRLEEDFAALRDVLSLPAAPAEAPPDDGPAEQLNLF